MNEQTISFIALVILLIIVFFIGYYTGVLNTKIKTTKENNHGQKKNE